MSRRFLLTAGLALGLAGAAQAAAQNLGAYQALAADLDAAAQSAGHDAVQTLTHLDAAQKAFEQLSPSLANSQIVTGLRDNINAARAAQARNPAELQAQVLLARGLMRKSLYDQTVMELAASPANGTDHLRLLATELGVDPQTVVADAGAGQVTLATWRLQKAAAAKLGAALEQVPARQTPQAYLNLSRASSWFTVVQDAGRTVEPPLSADQFQQALTQLAAGNLTELRSSLTNLKSSVGALNRSLAAVPGTVSQSAAVKTPAHTPSVPRPATPHAGAVGAGLSGMRPPGVKSSEMTSTGLSGAYTALGRALTAAGHADTATARALLATVPGLLDVAPAQVRRTPGYDRLLSDAQSLSVRRGLRPGDVQALIAELGAVENRAAGQPLSTLDNISGSAARGLGGGLRAVLGLLLALACAAPLSLLNLAFGGRNPFWRAISAALGLLLLPVFLDGLFGFLGWVGDLAGVPFVRSLTNFSLSQGAYGVPVLALLALLALALATYGFRGLCIQFGLLGRGPGQKTPRVAAPTSGGNTSFDWDEEV